MLKDNNVSSTTNLSGLKGYFEHLGIQCETIENNDRGACLLIENNCHQSVFFNFNPDGSYRDFYAYGE